MSADDKKVHPLRRKHRRGKRGGKKHRKATPPVAEHGGSLLTVLPSQPTPAVVASLRTRLSQLASRKSA